MPLGGQDLPADGLFLPFFLVECLNDVGFCRIVRERVKRQARHMDTYTARTDARFALARGPCESTTALPSVCEW